MCGKKDRIGLVFIFHALNGLPQIFQQRFHSKTFGCGVVFNLSFARPALIVVYDIAESQVGLLIVRGVGIGKPRTAM